MMKDKSYCSTPCNRMDCERNLRFYKPEEEYYSVTTFDDNNSDPSHKSCMWRIPKKIIM